MKNILTKDLNEVFASLREIGYEPIISNGEIEVERKVILNKEVNHKS